MACFLIVAACGGKTNGTDDGGDGDSGPLGRQPDGSDGNSFVDPHCPEAGPPPFSNGCDVFTNQPCDFGEACYPVAIPPQEQCQTESYGTFCEPVGSGSQSAPCNNETGCAAGFVCLITGASTACAQMCDEVTGHGCAEGFVCEPIDIPGFSACL